MRAVPICDARPPSWSASRIHGCSRCSSSGCIDGKFTAFLHHAVAQEVADGRGGLDADQFLRFFGRRRDVRRGDHLRQLGERPIGRRLGFEHVEPGAARRALLDGAPQRGFVDQLAARRVDRSGCPACSARSGRR